MGLIIDSAKTIGVIIGNGLSSDDHIPSLSLAAAGFQLLLGVVVLIAGIIVTILARTDTLSRKRNIQIFVSTHMPVYGQLLNVYLSFSTGRT